MFLKEVLDEMPISPRTLDLTHVKRPLILGKTVLLS